MVDVRVVVLAGGNGTRLWPLSRAAMPKPYLELTGEHSGLQQAVLLARALQGPPVVVCNAVHRFLAAEQAHSVGGVSALVLEPAPRGTGPALLAGAWAASDDDVVIVGISAEQVPSDVPAICAAVDAAVVSARAGAVVCIVADGVTLVRVALRSTLVERARSSHSDSVQAWHRGWLHRRSDLDFVRLDAESWLPSPDLDSNALFGPFESLPLHVEVAGIRDFDQLWSALPRDERGNAVVGDVSLQHTTGCLVHAQSRLVAVIDVHDLTICETADAVLIVPRNKGARVREVVQRLGDRAELLHHARVLRPWGSFEGVAAGERYQVKRIVVQPGAALSLQRHAHRAEHWVVVRGLARITRGDEIFELGPDESTYIPCGEVHRLENPGVVPLEIVEIGTGDYLGEDDIERLQDRYGR